MGFDASQQLTDSSVFDLIDNTGGPIIPSPDELNFGDNNIKETGSKMPTPGAGANQAQLVPDASQLYKETPGLEELFDNLEQNGLTNDPATDGGPGPDTGAQSGGSVGPDTGGEYDPSPDNDFWTGVDLHASRTSAVSFYNDNMSSSDNGMSISNMFITFDDGAGNGPGSDGLQDYFNRQFSEPEYVLQFLGGMSGGWNLETEPVPGVTFDPAGTWRKFLEWRHVWDVTNDYWDTNETTIDEYNESGGPRAIYEAHPELYGTDESQWTFLTGQMSQAGDAAFNMLYQTSPWDVISDPNGVWDEGEDWDDQSADGDADAWMNGQYDLGEDFTDVAQTVGQLGASISTYMDEVTRRENDIGDSYNNVHAPSYWEGIYNIPWADTVVTANELADAWQDDNWLEVYGPFISGLGITIEEFMEEYGAFLEPYNPEIPQEIQDTIGSFKHEARTRVQGDLDEERMNMVKSGFTESYQNTEALNSLINDFDATINTLDSDAAEDINNYNDSWYAGFIETMTELGEIGAFDEETWEDLLDPSSGEGDPVQEEVVQELEETASNTGFTQHYA